MRITNKFGLPQAFVNVVTNDDYSRGKAHKSVTQLIGSPRVDLLKGDHYSELEEDVSDRTSAIMGRAVHHLLEKGASNGDTVEERLFAEVDGWTISGAIDQQALAGNMQGYHGFYEVSDHGDVRSCDRTVRTKKGARVYTGRELVKGGNGDGYV